MMHAAETQMELSLLREGRGPFADGLRSRGIEWSTPGVSPIQYLQDVGVLEAEVREPRRPGVSPSRLRRRADQPAVDVGLGHQLRHVVGLDRTAVEDADFGSFILKPGREGIPYKLMNLLDISSRWGEARADRPDRLIGHHQIA